MTGYAVHLAVMVSVYVILAYSLDLVSGHLGLLSVAHGAFWSLGAYGSGLLATKLGAPFLPGLACGIGVAVLLSILVSVPSLRMNDEHFVVATFGFQMIVVSVLNNWTGLTRGPLGVSGIAQPVILGWHVSTRTDFMVLGIAFACLAYFVVYRLTNSPYGRVLHTIREDEVFAKAHGKSTLYFKITAFAVSGALAAMAGSLYAHYIRYIDPTSFTVMESILIVSMVIIGGAGSLWGPLVGAIVLVTLPEALRFIGLPSSAAADLRQVIYGSLLVIMVMFRPRGLVGEYGFSK